MNYHPLFFAALLLGSINLRFNLFYNPYLRQVHKFPFSDWFEGTVKRFVTLSIASLAVLVVTPITLGHFDEVGPALAGLFAFCLFGNCCISWGGILADDEYRWESDDRPDLPNLYQRELITPCWLQPITLLSVTIGVVSILLHFIL